MLLVGQHRKAAHGQHRLDDRQRIAMGLNDGGVGIDAQQRRQLLAVLIALQDPATVIGELIDDRLQHPLAIGVMRGLIVGEIIVAPARHLGHPFPLIGAEIRHLQLVLAAGMVRRMLVHRGHDRIGLHLLPMRIGTDPSWIEPVRTGVLTGRRDCFRTEIDG